MILRQYAIIVLTALLFSGCSKPPEDSSVKTDVPSYSLSSGREISVRIGPDDSRINSVIHIISDNNFPVSGRVSWDINGSIDEKNKSRRFVSSTLKKGDRVKAVIKSDGKEYESNELVIQNTPPSIHKAMLQPVRPGAETVLSPEVSTNDIDGDIVNLRYKWYLNEKLIDELSYLEYKFKRGDKVAIEIIPFDEEDSGKSVRLETQIYNSLPVINKTKPSIEGRKYIYQISATDADGDPLNYNLEKGPKGMTINKDGLITWELPEDLKRQYEVTVSVNDKHGGVKIIPFTASIYFEVPEE